MIRSLTVNAILTLYHRVMAQSGGFAGVRSFAALESAVMHPRATCDGAELYRTLSEKAAILFECTSAATEAQGVGHELFSILLP